MLPTTLGGDSETSFCMRMLFRLVFRTSVLDRHDIGEGAALRSEADPSDASCSTCGRHSDLAFKRAIAASSAHLLKSSLTHGKDLDPLSGFWSGCIGQGPMALETLRCRSCR